MIVSQEIEWVVLMETASFFIIILFYFRYHTLFPTLTLLSILRLLTKLIFLAIPKDITYNTTFTYGTNITYITYNTNYQYYAFL